MRTVVVLPHPSGPQDGQHAAIACGQIDAVKRDRRTVGPGQPVGDQQWRRCHGSHPPGKDRFLP